MQTNETVEQLSLFGQDMEYGKMCPEHSAPASHPVRISGSSSRNLSELWMGPFLFLDLRPGGGNLLGISWEPGFPSLLGFSTVATGPSPKDAAESFLSSILEDTPHPKYYLTPTACRGILRRAKKRGKELPPVLERALMLQAAIPPEILAKWRKEAPDSNYSSGMTIPINMQISTRHNQLGEGTGLGVGSDGDPAYTIQEAHSHGVFHAGDVACLTPWDVPVRTIPAGIAGDSAALHRGAPHGRDQSLLLNSPPDCSTPCSPWRQETKTTAFSCNQRDEVRDLCDLAGALSAQPGMKQQTFVATTPADELSGCLTPWDSQQARISTPDSVSPTLAGADGGGGRCPGGLVMSAAFSPKPSAKAGGIGYEKECSPTLTSNTPAVICLNDQGGQRMDVYENQTGTLRAQMDGHPPLVMATQQGGAEICENLCPTITASAGLSGNNQPILFEGHGKDARYNGPLEVAPTMSASYGLGGGNIPLAINAPEPQTYAISGTAIDRQPHNGGNGLGIQREICPSLTTCDRPAVFSQQRSDEYAESGVACTQAARQYKDSTDLVVSGLDCRSGRENGDLCGTLQAHPGGGYSLNTLHPVRIGNLVRRLTPTECELLQGFPRGWTDIPKASDSARYKSLGNSVAIPCVEYIMMGIAEVLLKEQEVI